MAGSWQSRRRLSDGTWVVARNKWVLRRMERRLKAKSDNAALQHRRVRAELAAERREAYWGQRPYKRALSGEMVEDLVSGIGSAVKRTVSR